MLENAGLVVECEASRLNERDLEAPLLKSGATPADIAEVLAIAKAENVAARHTGAVVIGCDQTLSLEGKVLHKPSDMEAARRRLLQLSGKEHQLHSAISLVRDGDTLWSHTETASIAFRALSPGFIGRHLADVGDIALTSVGAYQIEGKGIQLFERIDGDFFTIMGLPLLPLLAQLRSLGVLEA